MTNETRTEFEIPSWRIDALRDRLAKLSRRAHKLGCPAILFEVTGEKLYDVYLTDETGDEVLIPRGVAALRTDIHSTGRVQKNIVVRVVGSAPKFDGWTFAATIQTTEAGNILRTAPGISGVDFTPYRTCKPLCEHCQLERNRRDTFVLLHDSGALKQVGRQCLRDFLGHQSPEAIAAQAELAFSANEIFESESTGEGGGSRGEHLISLPEYLAHVAALTLDRGFWSKSRVEKYELAGGHASPTSADALLNLEPPENFKPVPVTDEARKLAASALAFVLAKYESSAPVSDFDHNISTVAKCEAVESRSLGIAAYIVEAYRRAVEERIKRDKAAKDSKHFGTVGVRVRKQSLTYTGSVSFESAYGTGYFHKFLCDGAELVWKTGTPEGWQQGQTFVADFTVKEHGEFRGAKQTYVNRLKEIAPVVVVNDQWGNPIK